MLISTGHFRAAALALGLASIGLVSLASSSQATPDSSTWSIDPAHTNIGFSIDAVGWPRTTGKFERFGGRIAVDFDHPSRSRVSFQVQASSIEAGSSGFNDFIRSAALLNSDGFPTIDFTSTSVEKTSEHTVRVTGALTLLGVTRPLSVDVDVSKRVDGGRKRLGFLAKSKIDRLDFGMSSGYPVISRDVLLTISSEALEP